MRIQLHSNATVWILLTRQNYGLCFSIWMHICMSCFVRIVICYFCYLLEIGFCGNKMYLLNTIFACERNWCYNNCFEEKFCLKWNYCWQIKNQLVVRKKYIGSIITLCISYEILIDVFMVVNSPLRKIKCPHF